MSRDSGNYVMVTAEERERIREQRCIDYFKEHGVVPCVCLFCGATIASRYNFNKHMKQNRRCMELRQLPANQ
jgi:hypothetical protein